MINLYKIFIVVVSLISFISYVLYSITSNTIFVNAFPATKDLYALFILLLGLLYFIIRSNHTINRELLYLYALLLAFFAFNFLEFLISPAALSNKIYNMRRHVMLPLVFMIFSILPFQLSEFKKISCFTLKLTILICVFGIFEYLMPDYFWDNIIRLPSYWMASVNDPFATSNIMSSGRFYSFDLFFLLGRTVRRLVSFYGEPTTLASFLSFIVILFGLNGVRFRYKKMLLSFIVAVGLLTYSKAFIMSVILMLFFKYIDRIRVSYFFVITGIFYIVGYYFNINGLVYGPFTHINGFYTGVNLLVTEPIGMGLGNAGNYGFNSKAAQFIFGGESGLGNLISQVGVFSLFFLAFIVLLLHSIKKQYSMTGDLFYYAAFVLVLDWYLIFMYSASSLGFSGNVFFFMAAGILMNNSLLRFNYRQLLSTTAGVEGT